MRESFSVVAIEGERVGEIKKRVLRWLDDMGSVRCGGAVTRGRR